MRHNSGSAFCAESAARRARNRLGRHVAHTLATAFGLAAVAFLLVATSGCGGAAADPGDAAKDCGTSADTGAE